MKTVLKELKIPFDDVEEDEEEKSVGTTNELARGKQIFFIITTNIFREAFRVQGVREKTYNQ